MKIKIVPYGMKNATENMVYFNPKKPVRICYWLVENYGWALGFIQFVDNESLPNRWFGGLFRPLRPPVAYKGGNIDFKNSATIKNFKKAFRNVYNVEPIIA